MITISAAKVMSGTAAQVWDVITDWEGQRAWVPLTEVEVRSDQRAGVGTRCFAFSGWHLGPVSLGLPDHFVVTEWDPPHRLVVQHVGRVFVGDGVFELSERDGETLVRLTERVRTPAGRVSDLALTIAEPVMMAGMLHSLGRLAVRVEAVSARG